MSTRAGPTNGLYWLILASIAVVGLLLLLLIPNGTVRLFSGPRGTGSETEGAAGGSDAELLLFCAAGMRYAIEKLVPQYEQQYGVRVEVQYGGSNTLLNQLEVSHTGDLYLAGDDSYIKLAQEKGLAAEVIPLAFMRPVIAVQKGNPKEIESIDDLLRPDVKVALGNPDAAAIGRKTRRLLADSGHWPELEEHVTQRGVYKPTVNEVANDVKLGSVDAGILWDSTVAQYAELDAVPAAELDAGLASVELTVLTSSENPTAALRFARYVGAGDRGLQVFKAEGFQVVDGDAWSEKPELTFFAGAVNRRALEPIVQEFERREGVTVNTVYNGCGILTAQMRTMQENQESGFPDSYMACDVYYLETVRELFQDAVNVSDTDIAIVVQKGNPKGIRSLADLVRPGVRVAVGQPDQCTIGVLTRRLLQQEGIYDKLLEQNVVTQTATSALLVPCVTTGSADAVLAYVTDTRAEPDRVDVVPIDSPLAKAVQPFSIARSSQSKYLGRRLFQAIARSRDKFESAGFHWRLDQAAGATASSESP